MPLPEKKVVYEADVAARLESVEYRTAIRDYMEKEVLPYVPDAWVDYGKTKIGYEIPLTRHFYVYTPPRPLEGDRRRDKGARSRDPGSSGRGYGVTFLVMDRALSTVLSH